MQWLENNSWNLKKRSFKIKIELFCSPLQESIFQFRVAPLEPLTDHPRFFAAVVAVVVAADVAVVAAIAAVVAVVAAVVAAVVVVAKKNIPGESFLAKTFFRLSRQNLI